MKRFWTEVSVDAAGVVVLDGKPVRTPGRLPLAIPFPALAAAVAAEWRAVKGEIDPRAMPLTGLANAAIERVPQDQAAFAANLARFGESDLLCYRAEEPPALVARQAALWDPLLAWARHRYDVHFALVGGVMHQPQPTATITRLREAVAARSAWELAGLSPVVTIGGSLIAGLALLEGAVGAETAWRAAEADEDWQTEQWGRDEVSLAALAARRRDFFGGAEFLALLR
ncbi:ATP12 family chaperone protein [Sphingomonas qilianensis]|uniref:ATP12 family protein n=1 Tax=Sphingomonas qilianensis TaxID=1736690 RepID=A0ABU9XTI6_9SPHN